MNGSRKRSIVYAVRDYPLGCGTHPQSSFKTPRTSDPDLVAADPRPYDGTCLKQGIDFTSSDRRRVHDCDVAEASTRKRTFLKQEPAFRDSSLHDRVLAAPRFKEAAFRRSAQQRVLASAPKPQGAYLKQEPAFRNSHNGPIPEAPKLKGTGFKQESACRSSDRQQVHAAAPKPQGACLKQEPELKNLVRDRDVSAPTPKGTYLKQEPAFRNSHHAPIVSAPRFKGASFTQEAAFISSDQRDLTPREQVLEVLRHFKDVFKQLDRDKHARRLDGDLFDATARIDIRTLAVLEKMGKQVNTEKRIGLVPGTNVGDEFQYKTELRLVGLHFKTMCGIYYMNVGDVKLATSIVASEGYGYSDKFGAGVVVYTGEGGNVVSKEKKTEDQRLVKGNLALANSMRKRSLVRVIRGEERLDKKGKRYVYDGLYLVDKYWLEKEVRGTTVYKFKLCRVSGQPLC